MTELATAIDTILRNLSLTATSSVEAAGTITGCPLIARTHDGQGIWLVWEGTQPGSLTEDLYEAICDEAEELGIEAPYRVVARRSLIVTDDVVLHHAGGVGLRHDQVADYEDLLWHSVRDIVDILHDGRPITGAGSTFSDAQWATICDNHVVERAGGALLLVYAACAALEELGHVVPAYASDFTDEDGVASTSAGSWVLPLAETVDEATGQTYRATISAPTNLDAILHASAFGRGTIHHLRTVLISTGQALQDHAGRAALSVVLPGPTTTDPDEYAETVTTAASDLYADLSGYLANHGLDPDYFFAAKL